MLAAFERVSAGLSGPFRRMEVAEEEIAAAKRRSPERAEELDGAFGALCPIAALLDLSEEVYRAHAREWLARIERGEPSTDPTDAELAAVVSATSLRTPLTRPASWVLWDALGRILPAVERPDEPFLDDYERSQEVPEVRRLAKQAVLASRT